SQVAIVGQLEGTGGQAPRSAREGGKLDGHGGLGGGLEVGRVAVVPAPVQAPDVAHHELGVVVYRPQVGPLEEVGRGADGVHELVEAGALVHEGHGLVVEALEELGRLGQRLSHAVGADHGQTVAGE